MNNEERGGFETLEANKIVHSMLALSGEYNKSPHFLPENRVKVRGIIESLIGSLGQPGAKLRGVDFGCGTGFIIDLCHDLLDEIHGLDITSEMMDQVDKNLANVRLHEGRAEESPFTAEEFDIAFGYSFLDHLADTKSFLAEAFRVLRAGGVLYTDLNPNRLFIEAVESSESSGTSSQYVQQEFEGALRNGDLYQKKFGIDASVLEQAEPRKTLEKGFDASDLVRTAKEVGFTNVEVEFHWFIGEAAISRGRSVPEAKAIDTYLQDTLPMSAHLYKYLRVFMWK